MKCHRVVLGGLLAVVLSATNTHAVTITIDKNGFADLAGGQITGTGLGSPVPLGTGTNAVSFTAVAGGTYSVDFFHNSGVGGSDFSLTVNGAGTGVATVGLGGGQHTMVTGFTAGDTTLTLNSHTITYNANGGQKGNYYLNGLIQAHTLGQNSPPQVKTAIPGWVAVDNLYNTGLNNEDYLFTVRSDGTVGAYTNAPHHAEFATFDGSSVNPRSVRVHYTVQSSTNLGLVGVSYIYPIENFSSQVLPSGDLRYIYRFTMVHTIGNAGHLFADFNTNVVLGSSIMGPTGFGFSIFDPGPSIVGTTRANDFLFNPRLRFTNDLSAPFAIDGYYFQNANGLGWSANALVTGASDGLAGLPPLTIAIDAAIPEPAALSLATVCLAGLLWRRRQR
jgi:hypothetical protein